VSMRLNTPDDVRLAADASSSTGEGTNNPTTVNPAGTGRFFEESSLTLARPRRPTDQRRKDAPIRARSIGGSRWSRVVCGSTKCRKPRKSRGFCVSRWPLGDSNPDALRHQILSLARLPISPSGLVRFSSTCDFEPCDVRKSDCWLTPLKPGAFSFVSSDPESTSGRSRSDCLPQTACSGRGVQTYRFYRRECDPAIAHREFLRGLKARRPNPESATTRRFAA
jgi:hypothetical protein